MFAKADGSGGAVPANPEEDEGDNDSGNLDDYIIQANLSAGEASARGKRSLEADIAASGSRTVPKKPQWQALARRGKVSVKSLVHK